MIRTYYLLTKPGIIMGNLITTVGGFALASRGHIDLWLFCTMFMGLGLVIASACVFNNYIDREADAKMSRTKNRPLAKGLIPHFNALLFANALGLSGIFILALYTNLLTVLMALLGFFIYVILYSLWKYRSTLATLVGSIAGALPPVIGYCSVSNRLDAGACILFTILVLWQMPHFFSIALYRFDDYAAASVPVLPIKKGIFTTKVQMLLYIIAFFPATLLLFSYTGYAYLLVAAPLSLAWLYLSIRGFYTTNDRLWARNMFRLSLLIVTALCLMMSIDVK